MENNSYDINVTKKPASSPFFHPNGTATECHRVGGAAQCQSTPLACMRSWVQAPALQKVKKKSIFCLLCRSLLVFLFVQIVLVHLLLYILLYSCSSACCVYTHRDLKSKTAEAFMCVQKAEIRSQTNFYTHTQRRVIFEAASQCDTGQPQNPNSSASVTSIVKLQVSATIPSSSLEISHLLGHLTSTARRVMMTSQQMSNFNLPNCSFFMTATYFSSRDFNTDKGLGFIATFFEYSPSFFSAI